MNKTLQNQILKAGRDAHDKMNEAWFATFFPGMRKQTIARFLKASRKMSQILLERQTSTAPDEDAAWILREIKNSPIEMAKSLRDVCRILRPEKRGRESILSDNDKMNAYQVFDALRGEYRRKVAVEKTAKQFGVTPQQMEGILRHKHRLRKSPAPAMARNEAR